ncbi:MAG: hypothetical protein C7B46_07825 [Sulfobacillus benefaciens]|uniref:Glutamine cyclotransferase n=1 Tax=Sulfobacillus benefaciens TaxID=453960 RepID=A0A2T2XHB1_9FIRM|nr:MAG: hypothetical protein C7B46_07825 [Sulfobacillus benefaciens]
MRLEVVRTLRAPGDHLCGVAWDGCNIWHSDGATNSIYQLDPVTGEVIIALPCHDVRTCLSFDENFLWQIAGRPKRIRIIRPSDGLVLGEIAFDTDPDAWCALHAESGRYWVGSKTNGMIEERDRCDHHVLRQCKTHGSLHGLARAGDILWYTDYPARQLVGWDWSQNSEIVRFDLSGHPTGLSRGWGDTFWYCDYTNQCLTQVQLQK